MHQHLPGLRSVKLSHLSERYENGDLNVLVRLHADQARSPPYFFSVENNSFIYLIGERFVLVGKNK